MSKYAFQLIHLGASRYNLVSTWNSRLKLELALGSQALNIKILLGGPIGPLNVSLQLCEIKIAERASNHSGPGLPLDYSMASISLMDLMRSRW